MTNDNLNPYTLVGQRLERYQQRLKSKGTSLKREVDERYLSKWRSEALYHVSCVRTALVGGMMDYLIEQGLLNLERVSVSLVTDPLAHNTVEHLPEIPYGGADYVTTHSMIYAKFMACHNPHLKGIFVDSPNIRLEPADPQGRQRGRYLIDFSQLDVEVRRNRDIELEAYLDRPREVAAILQEDLAQGPQAFRGHGPGPASPRSSAWPRTASTPWMSASTCPKSPSRSSTRPRPRPSSAPRTWSGRWARPRTPSASSSWA